VVPDNIQIDIIDDIAQDNKELCGRKIRYGTTTDAGDVGSAQSQAHIRRMNPSTAARACGGLAAAESPKTKTTTAKRTLLKVFIAFPSSDIQITDRHSPDACRGGWSGSARGALCGR
jgi:hypothetical protein